jgi:WD40 repeat protein
MTKTSAILQTPTILVLALGTLGIASLLTFLPSCDQSEGPTGILLGVHPWWVHCVAFSPDGKMLAAGGGFLNPEGEVQLRDVPTGTVRATLRGHQAPVYALAFTPDGRALATLSCDGMVKLWDVASWRERASIKLAAESCTLPVAFSPAGQTFAFAGYEPGVVKLWHLPGELEHRLDTGFGPFIFGADGRGLSLWNVAAERPDFQKIQRLAITGEMEDVRTEQQPLTLKQHSNRVAALAFSPDGQTLASGSYDQTVRLWEVATGREQASFQGHSDQVNAVAFASSGRFLVSASHDRTVRLWDLAHRSQYAVFDGHAGAVTSVAFSPDGRWVASGSYDKTVRLWLVDKVP